MLLYIASVVAITRSCQGALLYIEQIILYFFLHDNDINEISQNFLEHQITL